VKRGKKEVPLTVHQAAEKRLSSIQDLVAKVNAAIRDPTGEISQRFRALPEEKRAQVLRQLEELRLQYKRDQSVTDFNTFVRHVTPNFVEGPHLRQLSEVFHRIDRGESVRVIVNIAPRHGKSEHISVRFPAWYLGKNPTKQIIQASCNLTLVEKLGQAVKDIIAKPEYNEIFPDFRLSTDTKAKTKFKTQSGGYYFATSTTATAVGFGADVLILDDPHGEQSSIGSDKASVMPSKENFDQVWNWFTQVRARLQPGGSILIVMQRWSPFDMTGRIIERMRTDPNAEQYEVIEFPALLMEEDEAGDPLVDENGDPVWKSLWPEFWKVEELLKIKNTMIKWRWNAQYMQNPLMETSSIVPRERWKCWGMDKDGEIDYELKPPICSYIIQTWDTAFSADTRSDYSAVTTWGVFDTTDENGSRRNGIILLDAWRGQVDFPALKKRAKEKYQQWKPDACIIEAKATGTPLIHELRQMGMSIQSYTPTWQTGDKMVRLNSVSPIFEQGFVYYPPREWADAVIDEVALFPAADHDDYVDTVIMAMMRFRSGRFMSLHDDLSEEEDRPYRKVKAYY
jgi:predicted phage terminase large subunit-like protein